MCRKEAGWAPARPCRRSWRSLHLTLGVAHCFTLIRVVFVAHFPVKLFTAKNHGAGYPLSRSLPRQSHFIVRDDGHLFYSAPLLHGGLIYFGGSYKHCQHDLADHKRGTCSLRGIRSRLALEVEGLARVSKYAGGRPRLASVAFDGGFMGLAL